MYSRNTMKKAILYVPGLHDDAFINSHLTDLLPLIWRKYGFEVFIIRPRWREGKSFFPKLEYIATKIDELSNKGYELYLFGQSAGGSAVLNAFAIKKNKIKKVVNICGRLKKGIDVSPTLKKAAKGNPAFEESVLLFENKNKKN